MEDSFGYGKVRVFLLGIVLTTWQKNITFEGCCWFDTNLICTKAESKKLDSVQITAKQGRSYCINQDFSTLFCICLNFYYLLFLRKVELELGARF